MAIIKNKKIKNKTILKAKISSEILRQVENYCEWAGIYDLGFFIEEAAHYVFTKDSEWKEFEKAASAKSLR